MINGGSISERFVGRARSVAAIAVVGLAGIAAPVTTHAASTNVDPSMPDPSNVEVTELDSTLHVTWTPADSDEVAWQLVTVWDGSGLQQSKVAARTATVLQANGVTPGETYTVKVHSMAADGRLSPGAATSATAQPQMPMPDAAFFDNFNGSSGVLDGDLYDVRTTVSAFEAGNDVEPTRLDLRQVFNSEHHFHTQLIGAAGKGGVIIRPRVPFDFEGRTGTFQFEMDFPPTQSIHGKWMELVLTDTMLSSEEELGDAETGRQPNSLSFGFFQAEGSGDEPGAFAANTPVITTNIDGEKREFKGGQAIFSPTNVRLPVVIKVSADSAEILVNGESVATATDFGSLPFTTGYWHIVHRTYYSGRSYAADAPDDTHMPVMGLQLIHWDTVQYDGPSGSYHPVTKTYLQPGCNAMVNVGTTGMDDAPGCVRATTATIDVPDELADVRTVRMLMNWPTTTPTTATINGHTIDIPITPERVSYLGIAAISTVEIPPGWVRTGENSISFSGDSGYSQVELEVIFDRPQTPTPAVTHAAPMVAITAQNFYVEHVPGDPAVHTITTNLYSLGAPIPIDYTTEVSASTPWLTIESGDRGRLTSPALGGQLVPLTISVDTAHPDLAGRQDDDIDGRWAWVKVSGGHMPMYVGILVRFSPTRTEVAATYPFITTFNRSAIPGYHSPTS